MDPQQKSSQMQLEEVRIKKVGVLSFANTFALIYFFVGLLIGLIITIIIAVGIYSFEFSFLPKNFELVFSIWSVVILPVVLLIIGFVKGLIFAFTYNISAKISRGIKLHA